MILKMLQSDDKNVLIFMAIVLIASFLLVLISIVRNLRYNKWISEFNVFEDELSLPYQPVRFTSLKTQFDRLSQMPGCHHEVLDITQTQFIKKYWREYQDYVLGKRDKMIKK